MLAFCFYPQPTFKQVLQRFYKVILRLDQFFFKYDGSRGKGEGVKLPLPRNSYLQKAQPYQGQRLKQTYSVPCQASETEIFQKKLTASTCVLFSKQNPSQMFNRVLNALTRSSHLPEACNFIQNEALAQVFSCEVFEISKNTISNKMHLFFCYKQPGSGLSPQSCLYFQGFFGSKLPNGFLVV